MADNLIQPTFAAGELAPDLYARVDLAKYHTGLAHLRNMFVNYKGGVASRPGTQFIYNFGPNKLRLRRFVFSANQTYILVFATNSVFFIKNPLTAAYPNSSNSGLILSGGSPYSVATPYTEADLPFLKFSQSADIMNITCSNHAHPRMILSRIADNNWTLTVPVTGSPIAPPSSVYATITVPPTGSTDPATTTYAYVITSVNVDGQESTPSPAAYVTGLDMSVTLGSVTINWSFVFGATYYNVYRTIATSGNVVPSLGQQFGFVGFSYGVSFVESNIVPDFTRSPPSHTDPFSPSQIVGYSISNPGSGYPVEGTVINSPDASVLLPIFNSNTVGSTGGIITLYIQNPGDNITVGAAITATGGGGSGFAGTVAVGSDNNNPAVSAYFQQRLMLASTPSNPVTIYGSKSGYYNNFDKSNPILDNDSLTFTLAAQEVNAIEWMLAMPGGLVLFTDSSIQQLSGGSAQAINPAAVTPATAAVASISNFGANPYCEPIRIVYELIYVQSEGTVVRELTYNPFWGIVLSGADLTLLSTHLLYPRTIIDWAYQDVPFKCIWMIRDDGVLLSQTYLKEQEVNGWAHHDTQGGLFESVAVIREGSSEAVYFVVNRGGSRFVERLADRTFNMVDDAWCLDAAVATDVNVITTPIYISALTGPIAVVAVSPVFSAGDVGKIIRAGTGKMTVTSFVSTTEVDGIGVAGYPFPSMGPYLSWRMDPTFTTVTGLDHLDGKVVWAVADGVVQGPFTVSGTGSITLSMPASSVVVGLTFPSKLQTLYLDVGGDGRVQGKRKKIAAMSVRVKDTAGSIKMGTTFDTLAPFRGGVSSTDPVIALPTAPPGMRVGDLRMVMDPAYQVVGCVCVQQDDPLPLTVLGVIPEIVMGDM